MIIPEQLKQLVSVRVLETSGIATKNLARKSVTHTASRPPTTPEEK
jgi:hypothetical protein